MKLNKTILIGLIFILFAGVIFITDIFNPIIRPVTYLFLMGSSKGKDIIFFGLLGLFLVLSQMIKKNINTTRYFKISICLGTVILISGIVLEVMFRLQMGIKLNTIFCSMTSTMSSTSILHTHLLKSILGEFLTQIMGPFIQSDINTGVGLYSYIPSLSFSVIFLIPVLFATLVLAIQKRPWLTNFLIAFLSSCLIIGIIDGGMFATPSYVGITGLYFVYRNGFFINRYIGRTLGDEELVKSNEMIPPVYKNRGFSKKRYQFNYYGVYILIFLVILLRLTVAFAGAETDYYTVDIANPSPDIDLGNISAKVIDHKTGLNKTTYYIDADYNEKDLINDLNVPLKNSCEYYTVTWNAHSYFN